MTETEINRTNELKINKTNLKGNFSKTSRGISLDNGHKVIDGISQLITQTNKNNDYSDTPLNKIHLRNAENSNVKSVSPEKFHNIDYILPPLPLNKIVNKIKFF